MRADVPPAVDRVKLPHVPVQDGRRHPGHHILVVDKTIGADGQTLHELQVSHPWGTEGIQGATRAIPLGGQGGQGRAQAVAGEPEGAVPRV